MLIDTHAHIHFAEFAEDLANVFERARERGVSAIICVGTDEQDSARAVEFVNDPKIRQQAGEIQLFASAGLHPHEASRGQAALATLGKLIEQPGAVVAVGECGLDYYRNLSSKAEQAAALRAQIELALAHNLPLIFHVRDAWDDFFAILADYSKIRGVVHSFTGGPREVEQANRHGLYFGLNGIMTFTKLDSQLEAAWSIPADRLLLETDCPFLAPQPVRGRRNEPANISYVAVFLAHYRGIAHDELATQTTTNAGTLFSLNGD